MNLKSVFLVFFAAIANPVFAGSFNDLECKGILDGRVHVIATKQNVQLTWEATTDEVFNFLRPLVSSEIPDELLLGHEAELEVTVPASYCKFEKSPKGKFKCDFNDNSAKATFEIKSFKNYKGTLSKAKFETHFFVKNRYSSLEFPLQFQTSNRGSKLAKLKTSSYIVQDHWAEENHFGPECKVDGRDLYGN